MSQNASPALAFLLVPVLVIGGFFGFILLLTGSQSGNAAAGCGTGTASTVDVSQVPQGPIAGYNQAQLVVAAGIMNAAQQLGLSARAQQLGVMTAMGESSLQSLTYGDNAINPDGSIADSIGPFQQQSSWGTTEERLDPFTSATTFFQRLPTVENWETIEPTLAAHAVQGNADPYFYTTYWDGAGQITAALNGDTTGTNTTTAVNPAPGCSDGPIGFPLAQPFNMSDNFGPRVSPVAGASSYHPADDLTGACGAPVYAIQPGTVVVSDRLTLSVKSPEGYTVSYLHSYANDRLVSKGDQVTTGQTITLIGNEAPSTGCHLDIRVNPTCQGELRPVAQSNSAV
ncbi:murein DD-endopeptidase MepM/ murein hydrolase activator NlpD [Cryobacterium sp. MP_M5]|uniref:M23 family metallopeptidase n=1 Tax=unclassified Cryobacterium TaxID=2649013 RepID=UPI0018CA9453|nr:MULTISPECIES: M23 family metallopeptidase [unclassified Cryobacterium]MBG6059744.1 murein DD-endopeptidase MepM/ murein hydrolase activator NlpD [Cryobacterium sp. MP_M3]MEC5178177.1 murein DD-endopeptidase MepM/ murein hydrolase activator NlpD [Cryobacterium sp. MP_M5]